MKCPGGSYCVGGVITTCEAGSLCVEGAAKVAVDSGDDQSLTGLFTSAPCPPGKYCVATAGTAPADVPAGYYSVQK